MNRPQPTFESVFTPEYWEPVPERVERDFIMREFFATARATRATIAQARENLLLAGAKLIEGEPTLKVGTGELVGGEDDEKYALPGAVLLIDDEHVLFSRRKQPEYEYYGQITSELELSRSAIATFLGAKRHTNLEDAPNYEVYNGYHGKYISEEGEYTRTVNLYAYYRAKNGNTGLLGLVQWRNQHGQPCVIAPAGLFRYAPELRSGRVGETVNTSLLTKKPFLKDVPMLSRIKEAHICMRGTAEKAKARSKTKSFAMALNRATST